MTKHFIPSIALPELKSRETVYRGYFDVHVDLLKLHHGPNLTYTSIDVKANAAAIIAKTKDGKFIINKEYRHPTGKWLLSCPGGRIDTRARPPRARTGSRDQGPRGPTRRSRRARRT